MIANRKDRHLDIVLDKRARPTSLTTDFDRLAFEHVAFENVALPELRIHDAATSALEPKCTASCQP